jgi:hypothetical protein
MISASFSVTMLNVESVVMTVNVSHKRPFNVPANAAFAKPAPMEAATSAIVTECSKLLCEPSGVDISDFSELR